jgi:hypothetical protein
VWSPPDLVWPDQADNNNNNKGLEQVEGQAVQPSDEALNRLRSQRSRPGLSSDAILDH